MTAKKSSSLTGEIQSPAAQDGGTPGASSGKGSSPMLKKRKLESDNGNFPSDR